MKGMAAMKYNYKPSMLVFFTLLTFSLLLFTSKADAQQAVSLDDGGTLSGSFTYSLAGTGSITDWNFTVAGGNTPGFNYTPSDSTVSVPMNGFGTSSFFDFASNATSVGPGFPIGDLQFVTLDNLNPGLALAFLLGGTPYQIATDSTPTNPCLVEPFPCNSSEVTRRGPSPVAVRGLTGPAFFTLDATPTTITFFTSPTPGPPVPEPSTLLLLGSTLMALTFLAHRKKIAAI
jgi:hypothetical protein